MKFKLCILTLLVVCFQFASASVEEKIFIKGKITSVSDKKRVKITDSHGQTYWVYKSAFPEGFKFTEGKAFKIEVPESALPHLSQ